jgi:ATP-dependent Clp protease ATP-binding subunit ClpA
MSGPQAPIARQHPWSTFADARDEARQRGERTINTEHLLIALLRDPELARATGAIAAEARAALSRLDSEALAAIGLRGIPAALAEPGEPEAVLRPRASRPSVRELLTRRGVNMTPSCKNVLRSAGREAMRAQLGPEHILRALLDLGPVDPATQLLAALGVDRGAARQRLTALGQGGESAAA